MNVITAILWLVSGAFLGHALLAGDRGQFGQALGFFAAGAVGFTLAILDGRDS